MAQDMAFLQSVILLTMSRLLHIPFFNIFLVNVWYEASGIQVLVIFGQWL